MDYYANVVASYNVSLLITYRELYPPACLNPDQDTRAVIAPGWRSPSVAPALLGLAAAHTGRVT